MGRHIPRRNGHDPDRERRDRDRRETRTRTVTASGYEEYEPDGLLGFRKIHRNDEQTHVQVIELVANYAVVVIELDHDERLLRSDTLCAPATEDEAEEIARRYVGRHEKGMPSGGLLSGVFGDA